MFAVLNSWDTFQAYVSCVKYYTDLQINLVSKGFKQEMLNMLIIPELYRAYLP